MNTKAGRALSIIVVGQVSIDEGIGRLHGKSGIQSGYAPLKLYSFHYLSHTCFPASSVPDWCRSCLTGDDYLGAA